MARLKTPSRKPRKGMTEFGSLIGMPKSVRKSRTVKLNLRPNPASAAIWLRKLLPKVPPAKYGLLFNTQMLPASTNSAPSTKPKSFGRYSALASILSVLCFDFFFVPPYNSFAISDIQYLHFIFLLTFFTGLG